GRWRWIGRRLAARWTVLGSWLLPPGSKPSGCSTDCHQGGAPVGGLGGGPGQGALVLGGAGQHPGQRLGVDLGAGRQRTLAPGKPQVVEGGELAVGLGVEHGAQEKGVLAAGMEVGGYELTRTTPSSSGVALL